MIKILGMGTGEFRKLTVEGLELIENSNSIILQTDKIPVAEELKRRGIVFTSLDHIYDEAEDFDELKDSVRACFEKTEDGTLFCVLGSIYTNELVKALHGMEVEYIGGVGFVEEITDAAGPDRSSGICVSLPASAIGSLFYDGSSDIAVTEIDSVYAAYEVIEKLQRFFLPEKKVLYRSRKERKAITLKELYEIDDWDYSSSVYVPGDTFRDKDSYTVEDLLHIMDRLLGRNGCEWDKAQDHESLRQYLLEETYEVIEAINKKDDVMLSDELGDVLYQLVFHSKLAEKHSRFDFLDVSTAISKKMISRHPHVFSDSAVKEDWEEIKKKEKRLSSTADSLKDIPAGMGALLRAQKIVRKLDHLEHRKKDFQEICEDIKKIIGKMADQTADENDMGKLLFLITDYCYLKDINGEMALERESEDMVDSFR